MRLTVIRTLENNIFTVRLVTENFGLTDIEKMRIFGEPIIETGGTFGVAPNTFILPLAPRRLRTQFPVLQRFDGAVVTVPPAGSRALTWQEALTLRISSALTTLRAQTDTFTTESSQTM